MLLNTSKISIQINKNDAAIFSAQTILYWIFFSEKMRNKIEENNKNNAAPPVEGIDFNIFINVMRLGSLPFQFKIFPIQRTYSSIA